ncbi:MAG TPA: DUF4440 domain-containing protein [Anaerolineales bacterium]|nr:DUF4440 domain-containing protein [Anaerolineales bacterium]
MNFETGMNVLQKWMQAVNAGDVVGLLSLYDETAVLIPTFSSRILNSPAKLRDYFERLGAREDLSIALHEKTVQEQILGDSITAISGIYCWRFVIDGELLSFEARFSYLLNLASAHPILHHHSSQIPRVL